MRKITAMGRRAKYNLGNGIDAIGVADLINSLIAVKKLVFDEKK